MSTYRVRRRRQFCTFTLGSLHIGLPVEQVQEILRPQDVTTVPLVDPVVHGLINLRGQIVTAIDLRVRLQLPSREEGEGCMNVVINHLDEPISLLVDLIGDVVEVSEDNFELPPESLTGPARELVLGAYKLDGRLLLVLDIERAISLTAAL